MVTTAVLLLVLIMVLGVATAHQERQKRVSKMVAGVPRLLTAGLGLEVSKQAALAAATQLKVIPLTWNSSGSLYIVSFTVGSDLVDAAFDTGSARLIVATSDCTACDKTKYNPSTSRNALVLIDPRKARTVVEALRPDQIVKGETQDVLCSDTVSYVSQRNNILMYSDTVSFPRQLIPVASLCDGTSIDDVLTAAAATGPPPPPLTVTDYPIGGITSSVGSSSLNVFGMSGVLSVTQVDTAKWGWHGKATKFLMPSCQLSDDAAFESATIQAVALYYRARGLPVVWSQYIGVDTGFIVFGPVRSVCSTVQYVPMLPQLQYSNNALDRTPWRFYVVDVTGITVDDVPQSQYPRQFILDTGSTQTQLPGASTSTVPAINAAQRSVVIHLGSGTARAELRYSAAETRYRVPSLNTEAGYITEPVFGTMSDDTAAIFSSRKDVGLLGVTAMRNMYIEYDLTARRIGILQP